MTKQNCSSMLKMNKLVKMKLATFPSNQKHNIKGQFNHMNLLYCLAPENQQPMTDFSDSSRKLQKSVILMENKNLEMQYSYYCSDDWKIDSQHWESCSHEPTAGGDCPETWRTLETHRQPTFANHIPLQKIAHPVEWTIQWKYHIPRAHPRPKVGFLSHVYDYFGKQIISFVTALGVRITLLLTDIKSKHPK